MTLYAVTRDVPDTIGDGELAFFDKIPIDPARARKQHQSYKRHLMDMGATLIELPANPEFPDSVFVEDPVVVLDEVAVITRPGAESRLHEADSLAQALMPYRPLKFMRAPGTLDGGDVLRIGRTLFVGISQRTNKAGISQLQAFAAPFGYNVKQVPLNGCLHLKTCATYLGNNSILINASAVDPKSFRGFELIHVASGEDWAANALAIGKSLLFPNNFPSTAAAIQRRGFNLTTVDISQLQLAEAGLTCMSVLFEMDN